VSRSFYKILFNRSSQRENDDYKRVRGISAAKYQRREMRMSLSLFFLDSRGSSALPFSSLKEMAYYRVNGQ